MDVNFLEFDDENEAHIADHGITVSQLRQVLANRHITAPNPRRGAGQGRRLLIGQTHGGQVLAAVIAPTRDAATWRPITAWYAKIGERTLFERHTT